VELVRNIDEKMKPMTGFDVIKIALTYYASQRLSWKYPENVLEIP